MTREQETNGTMIQYFEWHLPANGQHWNKIAKEAEKLAKMGITCVWIPPPTKGASGPNSVGYDVYDLWDLGEFKSKGSVRTKYGTKEELINACNALDSNGIQICADVVLNHRLGADDTEEFDAIMVDQNDRGQDVGGKEKIKAWTRFTFPARGKKYSDLEFHWYHFTGIDYDAKNERAAVYRILGNGKYWSEDVDYENGNYDYLMGADVDYSHPEVVEDVTKWAVWLVKELKLSGFRMDALKHIDAGFIAEFLANVRKETGKDNFFTVGEYWKEGTQDLEGYLAKQDYKVSLFDVKLHYNFAAASQGGANYDMCKIMDGSLVQTNPMNAVTFVNNHDTQPGESLESYIEPWFQPHAYALCLLRMQGYPCIFYGDLYGISGENPVKPYAALPISNMIRARKHFAWGEQNDYFDHPNTIGWVRLGNKHFDKSDLTPEDLKTEPDGGAAPQDLGPGLAVVLCAGGAGSKHMFVGLHHKGTEWLDIVYPGREHVVVIDDNGFGDFVADDGGMAAYTLREFAEPFRAAEAEL
ncbi:alpha-amylase [Synchytrium microbalum]|uniref:Alpha-amylase n=1 Tax=Synchytrium microbalum TaxID=1806994 RepID=A0A507C3D5_9FUNG|nr:alpha-amylase [Synchytrium microbalum]TPX32604.1 alpha-amylase [Synchytrium microbalum]